ncbi:MAG: hypothetical protein H0W86_07760 [Armatimonadetes bacterium]|nr:hypothetical protein [Armatimonadota bacterium]
MELYISAVKAVRGQSWGDKNTLETIFGIKGMHGWGLVPGLAGWLTLDTRTNGPTPVEASIERHCVPCNGSVTVPLIAQAQETGGFWEGKDEFGSSTEAITLTCDCEVCSKWIAVNFTAGGVGRGGIEIQVSARHIPGGCCSS